MERCKNYFLKLNIFNESSGSNQEVNQDPYEQRTRVIATRVYFVLLVLILVIFLLLTCLASETITMTIQNPTLAQIESLPVKRICPCSKTSFPYDKFVSTNVSFHQVCSSDFVSDRWISSLFYGVNASSFLQQDFRSIGFAQFRALASFCQLSRANINQTLSLFGSSLFISTHLDTSPTNLHTKVITTVNRFRSSIFTTFKSQIRLISAIIRGNHFLNAPGTSIIPNKNYATITRDRIQIGYYILSYPRSNKNPLCRCTQADMLEDENCRDVSGIYKEYFYIDVRYVQEERTPTMLIPDLVSSCMPVDACLLSSLECFFNQTCVDAIFLYQKMVDGVMWNFTALKSNNVSNPSRFNTNSRIKSIVDELMVEEWNVQESFDRYFQQCAPTACTYSINIYRDFLIILNTFIGLLGGLCTVLHIIVLPVVRFIRRRLRPPPTTNAESLPLPSISFIVRLYRKMRSLLKRLLIELNLFKINSINNNNNDQSQIRYQRIATRLYIAVLAVCFIILTIYLAIIPQTHEETINNPTQTQFSDFYSRYPVSLRCPCSVISIPYNDFLAIEAHYHQICSSVFVSPEWLSFLIDNFHFALHIIDSREYVRNAASQFPLLKKLCTEAKDTITNSLEQFLNQTLITTQVIPKETFESQATALIVEWKDLTNHTFHRTLQLIRAVYYGNHLVASNVNAFFDVTRSNRFTLNSSINYGKCNCMTSSSCHSTLQVYDLWHNDFFADFEVSSSFTGCFPLEALLKSNLECFYNQTCIDVIADTIRFPNLETTFTALNITDDNSTNETIESLLNNMFVDEWSENISFDDYFSICDPQSCTYQYTRRRNIIFLITAVIGIFGGLATLLKNIFVILLWIITKIMRRNISRLTIRAWLHTHITEKQHLISGSRLVLLVMTLSTLAVVSSLTLQTVRDEVSKPTLENYEELLNHHSDTLQCPCGRSSIPYKLFMNVTVLNRHQVCSSVFVEEEWITTLLLPEPQSSHLPTNFRKTAIAFFQLLDSLCQLSEQHLIDELSNLLSRELINTNVISRVQLNEQIQSVIHQFQQNVPSSFLTTFQLIRAMISDNLLIPVFETNWKWLDPNLNYFHYWGVKLNTEPIVYNGSCNCGLSSQCFEESSKMPGFMVGCYPLESLLKSNLQCLYNVSCFSQLSTVKKSFTPLDDDSQTSRYEKNSSVELILNHLMVEQWFNSVTYEDYYNECAPSLCSYSYTQHRSAIEVVTLLLGLQGGLLIIMNFVARILVAVCQKALIRCQQRDVRVQPM